MHIEQAPQRALFRVVRACGITRGRPDPPILLLNQLVVGQAFLAAIAPFVPHAFVQAFGKRFSEPIGQRLRHDRVVVVVFCPEFIAQLLQPNPAGHCKRANVIAQSGFLRRNKISQRPARGNIGPGAFLVRLLAQKVESLQHLCARLVAIQFHIVAHCVCGKEAVHSTRRNQLLLNDAIQQSIGFSNNLPRLLALPLVLENARVRAF